jgi:hypothetical protein
LEKYQKNPAKNDDLVEEKKRNREKIRNQK